MIDPFNGRSPEDSREAIDWAARSIDAMIAADGFDDFVEPEPPDIIKEERRRRRYDRKARRAAALAVEYGYEEDVPLMERCLGVGMACAMCGSKMPKPGDPPRRCSRFGGDSE